MDNIKIGLFIKQLRNEKQMTQQQLADKLQVTNKAVSKWERGLNFPDITILEQLAKELDIRVDELLQGERIEAKSVTIAPMMQNTMQYSDMKLKQQRQSNYRIIKIILLFIFLSYVSIFILGQVAFHNTTSKTTIENHLVNDYFSENTIEVLQTFEGMYVGDSVTISHLFEELPFSKIPHLFRIEDTKLIVDYKETSWYLSDNYEEDIEANILYNATAAFTLINNLSELTMQFSDISYTFTREEINTIYEATTIVERLTQLEVFINDKQFINSIFANKNADK